MSDLVRGRLSHSARGRAALDELTDAPSDPEASSNVHAVLTDEIGRDAEFAGRLAVLLHAPSQQHTGSIVMTGSKVTHSQIALGPLTINNGRARRLSLVVGIFLAMLVVVAAYGGVRLVHNTDDSPGSAPSGSGTTRSGDRPAPLPPTTETVRRILPDRSSMDAKEYPWAETTEEVRTSAADISVCRAAPACQKNATAVGTVQFSRGENEGENQAEFLVLAFPDAATAHLAYTDIVQDAEDAGSGFDNFRKIVLERRGEESQGLDGGSLDGKSNPTSVLVNRALIFRQGAFIGIAHQMDDPTDQRSTRILGLSALLADRIAKADAGTL
ncbi:hypothetical protein [Streptomyces sp. NPDC050804]|uniref:hypothetical protein n=1 Tax=Streptomyces sp. NPDC050804 TaxID=3154745 RepID=UPI00341D4F17